MMPSCPICRNICSQVNFTYLNESKESYLRYTCMCQGHKSRPSYLADIYDKDKDEIQHFSIYYQKMCFSFIHPKVLPIYTLQKVTCWELFTCIGEDLNYELTVAKGINLVTVQEAWEILQRALRIKAFL